MPVIRNTATLNHETGHRVENNPDRGYAHSRTSITGGPVNSKAAKKKKPSNAFFLYRSHVLAKNLLPADVKHQNDASRVAAQMWKAESQETRLHFFALAEEKRKEKQEDEEPENAIQVPSTPPPPPLSPSSVSTTSSLHSSPPSTPYSACIQTPPAPKMPVRFLNPPNFPGRFSSPSEEFLPVINPQNALVPGYDEPVMHGLAAEWCSPQRTCSVYPTSISGFSTDSNMSPLQRANATSRFYPVTPAFPPDNDVSPFPFYFS